MIDITLSTGSNKHIKDLERAHKLSNLTGDRNGHIKSQLHKPSFLLILLRANVLEGPK